MQDLGFLEEEVLGRLKMQQEIKLGCYICGATEDLEKCQYCGKLVCVWHRMTFTESELTICDQCASEIEVKE